MVGGESWRLLESKTEQKFLAKKAMCSLDLHQPKKLFTLKTEDVTFGM
jgi:hypothetical protein